MQHVQSNSRLRLITEPDPAKEPLLLAEIKAHLRIDLGFTDHDEYLLALMRTARQYLEGRTGRLGISLATQTWDLILDDFPPESWIRIPLPPLQSITSLKYTDSDGAETTWPASNYTVDSDSMPGRLVLTYSNSWPSATLHPTNPIKIRFICGYDRQGTSPTTLRKIPEILRTAMLLLIEQLYDGHSLEAAGALVEATIGRLTAGHQAEYVF